jgi:hypothetical protein
MRNLKFYISGGCLANISSWILLLVASYVNFDSFASFLYYIAIFVGALLAGFLIAGKIVTQCIKTGIVTGLSSYVVYAVSTMLISGNILLPFRGELVDSLLILDFVLGGILGSVIRKIIVSRKK